MCEPQLETDAGDVLLNPIVLVEVLSDSTEAYDRGKKLSITEPFRACSTTS